MNEQGLAKLRAEIEREDAPKSPDGDRLACHLIENMGRQRDTFLRYRELAARQRRALIRNSLAENQQANEEADALCDELAHLEQQRLSLTNRILGRAEPRYPGRNPPPAAKCEELYPLLESGRAGELREARAALMEATHALRQDLEVNRVLAENARKIIHTTIVIMTSMVERPEEGRLKVYGNQGKVRAPQSQARSLYNRMV